MDEKIGSEEKRLENQTKDYNEKAILDRLKRLQLQRELLTAMTRFGDRKIHATELLAALAIHHGLHEEDLRPWLNAAVTMNRA